MCTKKPSQASRTTHSPPLPPAGHYVSFVRVGDKWFSCNDESVVPVAAHAVLKDSAYLLFYQRQVPRDIPCGPRSSPPTPAKAAAAAAAATRCEGGARRFYSVFGYVRVGCRVC
jgi:hypothetical protein